MPRSVEAIAAAPERATWWLSESVCILCLGLCLIWGGISFRIAGKFDTERRLVWFSSCWFDILYFLAGL